MEPPFPFGAAAATAAAAASAFGDKGGISLKTLRRRGRQVLGAQYPRLLSMYGSARAQLQEGLTTVRAGNRAALRASEDAATTSARRGLEIARAGKAGLGQSLTSRGLSGTSIEDADARAFDESSVRMLDEISANAGRARADIYQQGAASEAAVLSDLARLYQLQYASEASDYFSPLFDIMTAGAGTGQQEPFDASGFFALMQEFGGNSA